MRLDTSYFLLGMAERFCIALPNCQMDGSAL
jgi:hypothetical protein